jgi:hypothetical protein
MARYKMLPAPRWLEWCAEYHGGIDDETKHLKEIEPVFNRQGWFYDRQTKLAWYESYGRAWLCDRNDDFLYCLKNAMHRPLLKKERQAIKTLMQNKLCPLALKQLYWTDTEVHDLRETYRGARMYTLRALKD